LKFRQPNGLHAHRHLHKIQYEANAEVFQTFSDVFQTLYDQDDMQPGLSHFEQPDVVFVGGFGRLPTKQTLEPLTELFDVLLNVIELIAVGKCVAVDKFVAGTFKLMVAGKWNHGVKIPDNFITVSP
jgi:hypothetical protein